MLERSKLTERINDNFIIIKNKQDNETILYNIHAISTIELTKKKK